MRITDELREWVTGAKPAVVDGCSINVGTMTYGCKKALLDIADRIDGRIDDKCEHMKCEYEREFEEWKHTQDTCYIKLPVDADGVPICVGDVMETVAYCLPDVCFEVRSMTWDEAGWRVFDRLGDEYKPSVMRHYHERTVKDVLREMAIDWDCAADGMDKEAVPKEYAAKLRLASDK